MKSKWFRFEQLVENARCRHKTPECVHLIAHQVGSIVSTENSIGHLNSGTVLLGAKELIPTVRHGLTSGLVKSLKYAGLNLLERDRGPRILAFELWDLQRVALCHRSKTVALEN